MVRVFYRLSANLTRTVSLTESEAARVLESNAKAIRVPEIPFNLNVSRQNGMRPECWDFGRIARMLPN